MGIVDQSGLPQSLRLSFNLYVIKMTMNIGRSKMNDYDKKLTRVVSTKLSIEDDNFLQQLTTNANRYGIIKPTKSAMVRFLITVSLSSIRQEMDKQSLPSQKSEKARNIA
jgi:hypothetical protein